MKKYLQKKVLPHVVLFFAFAAGAHLVAGGAYAQGCQATEYLNYPACTSVDVGALGFKIPSLGDLLTFAIRAFFVIAGLAALFYLLLGALAWVTSGGDKDSVTAAREKIQAAVIGMILIVAVLAIIWTMEQVIFNRKICLGLSCPLTLPGLVEGDGTLTKLNGEVVMSTSEAFCCVCLKEDGSFGDRINTRLQKCEDGVGIGL